MLTRNQLLDLYLANFDVDAYNFRKLVEEGDDPGAFQRFVASEFDFDMAGELARGLDFATYVSHVIDFDTKDPIRPDTPEYEYLHEHWEDNCRRYPYYRDSIRYFKDENG